MAQMNMIEAIRSAHDVMMDRDPSVVVLGEDVGYFGGVFRCTDGLQRKYGEHRVIDAPIAEGGIIAAAIGMGVNGLRPVAEIQFADYIYPGFDQIGQRTRTTSLSLLRRVLLTGHHPHAVRRRYSRRADALAVARGNLHARQRHQDRDAVQSLRREGSADQRDRIGRPGRLFRAQAHLQRSVRRRPREAGRVLGIASER